MLLLASDYGAGYEIGSIAAIVVLAVAAVGFGRRAVRQRQRRARTTDIIVALVCAALLVGALVRFADRHSGGPWDTQQGRELHAGFVAGCRPGEAAGISCECIFQYVARAPPYDTPQGFMALQASMAAALRARDPRALPPVMQAAVASCRVFRSG